MIYLDYFKYDLTIEEVYFISSLYNEIRGVNTDFKISKVYNRKRRRVLIERMKEKGVINIKKDKIDFILDIDYNDNIKVIKPIQDDESLINSDKVILFLLHHFDSKGINSFYRRNISNILNISERTISRFLNKREVLNYIEVETLNKGWTNGNINYFKIISRGDLCE